MSHRYRSRQRRSYQPRRWDGISAISAPKAACRPLADVGDWMERLYYGTGSMRTPEDLAANFRTVGGHTQWVDAGAMSQYSRVLHATGPGLDTYIMMFNDKDACQLAMSMIEK
jgi:hypothetical protein